MPVSPYTRERLGEAAKSSRTLSEALRELGVEASQERETCARWTREAANAWPSQQGVHGRARCI